MGNHAGKHEPGFEKGSKAGAAGRGDGERSSRALARDASEDSDVFGEADVAGNNGPPSQGAAAAGSRRPAGPKNAWPRASPAEPGGRPHLTRLFSRDAPGREDNTFKERPSESDEPQSDPAGSAMAQKRPSQRHGSKYLASASTMDHVRHGFLPRRRDSGFLDSLGRLLGGGRPGPKRGSGKVSAED